MSSSPFAAETRDGLYSVQIETATAHFHQRVEANRATTDMQSMVRAATWGTGALLLVDIDEVLPGTVNGADGSVFLATKSDATTCGVIDEITGRAILAGGRVMAVRWEDMPDRTPMLAILRYPI